MAEEGSEPTNKQLANFLVIYAKQNPAADGLNLSPPILESLMSSNPQFRAGALSAHKRFCDQLKVHSVKMEAGELKCEHILKSGRRCPNYNEPGSMYCGLHKSVEEEGVLSR